MFLRIWRFITITLTALVVGMAFCHTLELPAKMQYSASLYVTVQNSLYAAFGPPNIGAFLEPAAVLCAFALAVLVRKRRLVFLLTLIAAVLMFVAFPAIFFTFTEPVNAIMRNATPDSIPANWEQLRNQWEYSHAARFVCHLIGFGALISSVLLETPGSRLRERVFEAKV